MIDKPSTDRLEIMCLQNQLDVLNWTIIAEKKETDYQYEMRTNFMKRYKKLTGEDYVYQAVREQFQD